MKKISLSLVLMALAFSLIAQDEILTSQNGVPILPVKGDISIGIDAVPFFNLFKESSQAPSFSSPGNIPMIALRYLLDDKRALRMEFAVNYISESTEDSGKDVGSSYGINFGHEWRKGTTRVQGFTGIQGGLIYGKLKSMDNSDNVLYELSSFGIGIEGFLGAEYFIAPKLSIGGQFSWGPTYTVINTDYGDSDTEKTTIFDISADNIGGALILSFYF